MAKITFITPDGGEAVIEDAEGSLMEIATENDVEGIDGDCGGVCSCSTCHVRLPAEWLAKVGKADGMEADTLAYEDDADERSRLCCQIEMTDELDGLVVEVAPLN